MKTDVMETSSKPIEFGRTTRRVIVALVAVVFVYALTYFAALEGKVYWSAGIDPATGINRYDIEPTFRCFGPQAMLVFKPALWIDRRVRNEYWSTVENKSARMKWRNP